ncbi:MAG: polyprenyl synthetase family protein [Anaerolineae bacterium]
MASTERLATGTLAELLAPVRPQLRLVEERITRAITTAEERLDQAYRDLFDGGKRLRPAISLLCAGPESSGSTTVVALGAALEMLHTATLIHDDIIDDATVRRGKATIGASLGSDAGILAGDHLFARAASVVTETGNLEALRVFAETLVTISGGELAQLWRQERVPSLDEYQKLIYAKTACLFESAALGGALLAGRPRPQVERFAEYGRCLGMAFQIADDVLDYVGDTSVMGKPTYSDLRNGHLTLPILLYLQRRPGVIGRTMPDSLSDGKVERLVRAVVDGGYVEGALGMAREYAGKAWASVDGMVDGEYAASLRGFTQFAISRMA